MSKKTIVSVIIPTYNRAKFITQSIDSVLSQTYKNFEIIVVDDGSTDNTKETLIPYRDKIRYIYQRNHGASAARNTGIKHARGKYVAFLDSDDLWLPQKLEKQVRILDKNKDIGLVYSNFSYADEVGKITKVMGYNPKKFISGYIFKEILLRKAGCGYLQTWLIRKSCFKEVGYLDEKFKMSEDRDIFVRITHRYNLYGISKPLTIVRQHTPVLRLGRSPTKEREYYYFKFLDKLFKEIDPTLNKAIKKRLIADYYYLAGRGYLKEMNSALARRRFWRSIINYPFKLNVYPYFISTFIGKKGLNFLMSIRKFILRKIKS